MKGNPMQFIGSSGYWTVSADKNNNLVVMHGDGTEISWESLCSTTMDDEYWPASLSPQQFAELDWAVDLWLEDQYAMMEEEE